MIKLFSRTFALACILALSAVVLACSADTEPAVQTQDSATSTSAPDFVRITVTPAAIDTATPTAVSQFTVEQLADPVFPDWLDPDIASVRPSDEEIVSGWIEFLTDVQWNFKALDESIITGHLCGDGSIYWNEMLDGRGQDWEVALNQAAVASNWDSIVVRTKVSEFRWSNRLALELVNGEISDGQVPIVFERSQQCLELAANTPSSPNDFTPEQLAAPIFPDWLDPDIATEQPTDDEIVRGWTEFVTNVVVTFEGGQYAQHFCADGAHLYFNGNSNNTGDLVENVGDWNVQRNPAISSKQWGTVKVYPWLDLTRSDGKLWRQNVEAEIARSVECLERNSSSSSDISAFTPEQLSPPVFPDWLDPDIATEQPTDEEIFAGWIKYFADTSVSLIDDGAASHYCADGTYFRPTDDQGNTERDEKQWEVTRPSVLSASDWGVIEILGRWFSRTDGKTVLLVRAGPREVEVKHSLKCEELSS